MTTAGPEGRPSRRARAWRWVARGGALAVAVITVMVIALAVGMRRNDAQIDANPGTSTATVLSVSALRTGIEFVDDTGAAVRPENGVLYPGLLAVGQQFVVEYSTQDPQIARVAGRTAAVGTFVLALTLGITYLVALPLIWICRRRSGLPVLRGRRGARDGHRGAPVSGPLEPPTSTPSRPSVTASPAPAAPRAPDPTATAMTAVTSPGAG